MVRTEEGIKRYLNDGAIHKENSKLFWEYDGEMKLNNQAIGTRLIRATTLCHFARDIKKPFLRDNRIEVKREDVNNWLANRMSEGLKPNTINSDKGTLKHFFRWLNEKIGNEGHPDCVKGFKITMKGNNGTGDDHKDTLTRKELYKIIETARTPKDKALLMLCWETGARIHEILSLNIGSITFFDTHAIVDLHSTKTKKNRKIPITESISFLKEYLNQHPHAKDKDTPLFTARDDNTQRMPYVSAAKQVKRLAKKAGIKKNVYLHLFRHSRLTELVEDYEFNEFKLKKFAGWTMSSGMADNYIDQSKLDLEVALGIEKEEKETKEIKRKEPKLCGACKEKNPYTNRFCFNCGRPLDAEIIMSIEETTKELSSRFDELLGQKIDGVMNGAKLEEIIEKAIEAKVKEALEKKLNGIVDIKR